MRSLGVLLGFLLLVGSSTAQAVIEVVDAQVAELDEGTGILQLLGDPVRVRRGEVELRAPRVHYDRNRRILTAEEGVELLRPGERLTAHRLRFELDSQRAEAQGDATVARDLEEGTAVLQAPYVRADLRAQRAEATGGVRCVYREGRLWARSLSMDWAAGEAVAEGDPEGTVEGVQIAAGRLRADLRRRVLYGTGGVRITDGRIVATAQELEARSAERLAVLRGGVEVVRGRDRLTASEVWYAYAEGTLRTVGRARVVVRL